MGQLHLDQSGHASAAFCSFNHDERAQHKCGGFLMLQAASHRQISTITTICLPQLTTLSDHLGWHHFSLTPIPWIFSCPPYGVNSAITLLFFVIGGVLPLNEEVLC